MSPMSDDEMLDLLRTTMRSESGAVPRDLWPQMRTRLDERPAASMTFDWLLVVAALLLVLLQPAVVGILLLHF